MPAVALPVDLAPKRDDRIRCSVARASVSSASGESIKLRTTRGRLSLLMYW